MKKAALKASALGLLFNLLLFLLKFYMGLSTNALTIYCDAVNNLGDTFACGVALFSFVMSRKLGELPSKRAQSLCTFVISLLIAGTGIYFVYNGLDRLFYPLPVSYSTKYAVLIALTIAAKLLMGLLFRAFNKKESSSVLKALALDSFLDCFITLFALMSILLVPKVNFAVDGVFAIITGSIITASAIKNIIAETKFLVRG